MNTAELTRNTPEEIRQIKAFISAWTPAPSRTVSAGVRRRLAARKLAKARSTIPLRQRQPQVVCKPWPRPPVGSDLISLFAKLSKTADVQVDSQ